MSDTKNDIAWNEIFVENQILNKIHNTGVYEISSKLINRKREARLMTKIDHKNQLPKIFKEYDLSILPVTRGSYIIGHFNTFHEIESGYCEEVIVTPRNKYESMDYNNITSEAMALNCCYATEIFQDFMNDDTIIPTVNGRMSSELIEFKIKDITNHYKQINVCNSQIEIDGGYEGLDGLYLIEAKNYLSEDFIIRQLFYPYKLWINKVAKKVVPIFMIYSNGKFNLREYQFLEIDNYNSIELVKQKSYYIKNSTINMEVIQNILENVRLADEPRSIFPQADDFNRIINLTELINAHRLINKEKITEHYGFDKRQTDYYFNAGRYLGIFDIREISGESFIILTIKGKSLMKLSLDERQVAYIRLILSFNVFNSTFRHYLTSSEPPKNAEVVKIMKNSNLYNVNSDSTFIRRASTVTSWINWILNQIDE